ncbi:MAG: hypothetical protein HGA79_03230 [Anaerolineales bacterium]|nr:hypothetical protein [Anaerolineales bacterium]
MRTFCAKARSARLSIVMGCLSRSQNAKPPDGNSKSTSAVMNQLFQRSSPFAIDFEGSADMALDFPGIHQLGNRQLGDRITLAIYQHDFSGTAIYKSGRRDQM